MMLRVLKKKMKNTKSYFVTVTIQNMIFYDRYFYSWIKVNIMHPCCKSYENEILYSFLSETFELNFLYY